MNIQPKWSKLDVPKYSFGTEIKWQQKKKKTNEEEKKINRAQRTDFYDSF